MRTLLILPFISLTLSSRATKVAPSPFTTVSIGPFFNGKNTTIVVRTSSSNCKIELYLINEKYPSPGICFLSEEMTSSGTYKFIYDNEYTRNTNKVYLKYYIGPTGFDSSTFDWNKQKSKYEVVPSNQNLTSDLSVMTIDKFLNRETRKISYNFEGFDSLYVPEYYQRISLTDFMVSASAYDTYFIDCTPSLIIYNYNNVFDGITGAGETATFDLKLVQQNGYYTFALKNIYWVDVDTFKMYSVKRTNCVSTKNLYLPFNDMKNQDKYDCYLYLNDFGVDKDILVHNFKIKALRNIFGDCSNSKYCIVRDK